MYNSQKSKCMSKWFWSWQRTLMSNIKTQHSQIWYAAVLQYVWISYRDKSKQKNYCSAEEKQNIKIFLLMHERRSQRLRKRAKRCEVKELVCKSSEVMLNLKRICNPTWENLGAPTLCGDCMSVERALVCSCLIKKLELWDWRSFLMNLRSNCWVHYQVESWCGLLYMTAWKEMIASERPRGRQGGNYSAMRKSMLILKWGWEPPNFIEIS